MFMYYHKLSKPILSLKIGNPVDVVTGRRTNGIEPGAFVSSVCWFKKDPTKCAVANSYGKIAIAMVL